MAWPQAGGYSHPSPYRSDPRSDSGVLRPVRGVAIGAVLGLVLWIAFESAYVGVNAWHYLLVGRLQKGERVDESFLKAHDAVYGLSVIAQYAALVVAAVLFVIWLFRVRANAEVISDSPHRGSRPWLVFSWIVPIVNLWWPMLLVDDIWVASDPRFHNAPDRKGPWLLHVWWVAWVLYLIFDRVVEIPDPSAELGTHRQAAMNAIIVAPVGVLAAVLAIVVVLRLSGFQETRRRELAGILG